MIVGLPQPGLIGRPIYILRYGGLHNGTEAFAQNITGVGDHGESIFIGLLNKLLQKDCLVAVKHGDDHSAVFAGEGTGADGDGSTAMEFFVNERTDFFVFISDDGEALA